MKKVIKRIGLGLLILVGMLFIIILILYHNVIMTMLSVKQVGNEQLIYQEKIYGNCYFNTYMESNIKSSKELSNFLTHNMGYGLLDNIDSSHGCSAFFAKTPEGDILLCNDVDHNPANRTPVVMEAEILGKKTIGFTDMVSFTDNINDGFYNRILMYMMPYTMLSGFNEDGLAVGIAAAKGSYQDPIEGKPYIFDNTIPQLVLSNASNVEEAITFLEKYNIGAGDFRSHYMLVDSTGNCAIVEWNGDMKVYYPEKDYLIMSNFPIYYMTGFGKDRYENYVEALDECNGVLTEEEAMKLLKANRIKGDEFVSVVYNLTQKTARMYFEKPDMEILYSFSD